MTRTVIALCLGLSFGAIAAESKMSAADMAKTMAMIPQWIGGNYSSQAQFDADQASAKPDTEKHRLMFQLFTRIEAPAFKGILFFEQGSRDGSTDPDMIWRSGLVQIIPDEKLGVVRYRELAFKDQKPWHNAHTSPDKFKMLTPGQVTWDEKCDFLLTLNKDGTQASGPIPKMQCSRMNDGTGERMYADDKIVIKQNQFWFLGRYVNAKGQHIWGNESDELNKLVRFGDVPK